MLEIYDLFLFHLHISELNLYINTFCTVTIYMYNAVNCHQVSICQALHVMSNIPLKIHAHCNIIMRKWKLATLPCKESNVSETWYSNSFVDFNSGGIMSSSFSLAAAKESTTCKSTSDDLSICKNFCCWEQRHLLLYYVLSRMISIKEMF